MRAAALLLLLVACSGQEAAEEPSPPPRPMPIAPRADAAIDAYVVPDPTFRLPEGVAPLGYDLRLEIDPEKETFSGSVEIRVQLAAATHTIWLHAGELEITGAAYRAGDKDGLITANRASVHDLRALGLDRSVGPGEITLKLAYRGPTYTDYQGLFRQKVDGKWAMFSQSEAGHARRIVPCFDEPRFKVPWKVTLAVPADQVALANAAVASEEKLPDGRREVRFAATAPMASYLLAVAVGPFVIVDGGTVGRAKLPFRVIAWKSARAQTAFALKTTPKIVDALEAYFDQPLPVPKLDFLAVPSLFGAMEHPGLVTYESSILLGDARFGEFRRHFIRVAAHELAHQWMGNLVTPAWWDDLWLSEAFAEFLGDKISAGLDGFDDVALRTQSGREHALAADAEATSHAIQHEVAPDDDLDETFDAIAYEKGAAVLAMFEQHIGADKLRDALRAYTTKHAQNAAVTADLVAEVVGVSTPEVGAALGKYLAHTGTPIVELELRCTGTPVLAARARDGMHVPVCIRYPTGAKIEKQCALVGDRAELPLAGCPAWLVGNDDARGYYQIAWTGTPPFPPLAIATPAERLAYGDDLAGAVMRGELAVPDALEAMQQLADSKDPYAVLAALAIGGAIDPLVPDAARATWTKLLAKRFAARLTATAVFQPKLPVDFAIRDALFGLVPPDALAPAIVARARGGVDRILAAKRGDLGSLEIALAIAAPSGGAKLFDRIVARAKAEKDDAIGDALLESLGAFGPELAPRVVDLALDTTLRPAGPVGALTNMLSRPATRTAAWTAVHAKIAPLLMRLAPIQSKRLVDAFGELCDPDARAAIAKELPESAAAITDGKATIDRAIAGIERCLARRAKAGDLAGVLAP